nr:hypothetical protein Itr_chr13CG09850 [Ipomoea trifida]
MNLQSSITKLPFPPSGRSFEELVNGARRRRARPWRPLLQLPARQANSDAAPLLSSTTTVGGTRNSYGGNGGGATVIDDEAPVVDLPRSDVVRRGLSAAGRRFAPACT